jgi:outer membrane protein assembly factor BamB
MTEAMKHLLSLLLFSVTLSVHRAEDWPEWRGPTHQGHSTATGLPETWSESQNIAWKTTLPGRGHSTPVSSNGQIWLTTAIETPASPEDAERRVKANDSGQPVTVMQHISLCALMVDAATGKIQHHIELLSISEPDMAHVLNSYATPSPLLADGRLYAHFGSFGTVCLDIKTQKILWKNQELKVDHDLGPGSSPILWQDKLIVCFDGTDIQFITAFDATTGAVSWKTPRTGTLPERGDMKKAYSTPLRVSWAGKEQIISHASNWIYGYEPATGTELWKLPYGETCWSQAACLVADAERIYLTTGYGKSEFISLKAAAPGTTPAVAWRHEKNAPKMSSPLLIDGKLFCADDGGIVQCLEAATGTPLYRERLKGKFSASPIHAEGKIYLSNRDGITYVLPATAEFKVLAENKLDGTLMASPIAIADSLYFRTDKALYRIKKP